MLGIFRQIILILDKIFLIKTVLVLIRFILIRTLIIVKIDRIFWFYVDKILKLFNFSGFYCFDPTCMICWTEVLLWFWWVSQQRWRISGCFKHRYLLKVFIFLNFIYFNKLFNKFFVYLNSFIKLCTKYSIELKCVWSFRS